MSTLPSLRPLVEELDGLPDGALVPVSWVRRLVEEGEALGREERERDLTVTEVAERFDRSEGAVRGWCRDERLPGAYRLNGREWRIPRGALEELRPKGKEQGLRREETWRDQRARRRRRGREAAG